MLQRFRAFWAGLFTPLARLLLRLGVSPDAVTLVGTVGVSAPALVLFPQGELGLGTVVITLFVFSDLLDGTMARLSGRTSRFGAFLDSTLDRMADASVFAGLVLFYAGRGDLLHVSLALVCLVAGALTSYARARAESLGFQAHVGIAERADRLVVVLIPAAFSDWLGLPVLLSVALWLLAVASTVTVVQRIWVVRRQALAGAGGAGGA